MAPSAPDYRSLKVGCIAFPHSDICKRVKKETYLLSVGLSPTSTRPAAPLLSPVFPPCPSCRVAYSDGGQEDFEGSVQCCEMLTFRAATGGTWMLAQSRSFGYPSRIRFTRQSTALGDDDFGADAPFT